MNTDLFSNDSADASHVFDRVNKAVDRSGRGAPIFARDEALAALRQMNEANQIMFLEDEGVVYKL